MPRKIKYHTISISKDDHEIVQRLRKNGDITAGEFFHEAMEYYMASDKFQKKHGRYMRSLT